jgi:hypothetical protein
MLPELQAALDDINQRLTLLHNSATAHDERLAALSDSATLHDDMFQRMANTFQDMVERRQAVEPQPEPQEPQAQAQAIAEVLVEAIRPILPLPGGQALNLGPETIDQLVEALMAQLQASLNVSEGVLARVAEHVRDRLNGIETRLGAVETIQGQTNRTVRDMHVNPMQLPSPTRHEQLLAFIPACEIWRESPSQFRDDRCLYPHTRTVLKTNKQQYTHRYSLILTYTH